MKSALETTRDDLIDGLAKFIGRPAIPPINLSDPCTILGFYSGVLLTDQMWTTFRGAMACVGAMVWLPIPEGLISADGRTLLVRDGWRRHPNETLDDLADRYKERAP